MVLVDELLGWRSSFDVLEPGSREGWNRATARVAPTFPLSDEVRSFTTGTTAFAPEEQQLPMRLLDLRQYARGAVWLF